LGEETQGKVKNAEKGKVGRGGLGALMRGGEGEREERRGVKGREMQRREGKGFRLVGGETKKGRRGGIRQGGERVERYRGGCGGFLLRGDLFISSSPLLPH